MTILYLYQNAQILNEERLGWRFVAPIQIGVIPPNLVAKGQLYVSEQMINSGSKTRETGEIPSKRPNEGLSV